MFHFDYKYIIDRLPESLIKKAYESLLHQSKDPVLLESISEKSKLKLHISWAACKPNEPARLGPARATINRAAS